MPARNFLRALPLLLFACLTLVAMPLAAEEAADGQDGKAGPVSFYHDVRPIFQAHCQGCHQPAKDSGEYVMTDFARMLGGGESTLAAIVPGKPAESYLLDQITPDAEGAALMPKDRPPLHKTEIELIRRWIAEGAKNDTPSNARERYDLDHPPVYTRPPVVTAMDYSPDGKLLAVAGFHEVLLAKGDGSGLAGRLIGLSERIQSVVFSPDGARLLVTGGLPGRTGEIQVWDVAKQELLLSKPITFDTIYGGSWSPDGKLIAFGCADNTVRAIDSVTGEQVLFQGAHNDWVRDTVFSKDGSHLVSVGRDMSVKLIEVATQRFVDNITSITPGALKGGVSAIDRHPERDQVVIGGSDGVPKVYRMERLTKRVIGDDANLIRRLPAMTGRIFDVAFSPDGTRIAAGSSLDGAGEVAVFAYETDGALPDDIKAIMGKQPRQWNADEKKKAEAYWTTDVRRVAEAKLPTSIYAVTFSPDGMHVAAAGADGAVRVIEAETGKVQNTFQPAPVSDGDKMMAGVRPSLARAEQTASPRSLPEGTTITALDVRPSSITLSDPLGYTQLLVTGVTADGQRLDVTRLVTAELSQDVITISPSGLIQPKKDGEGFLNLKLKLRGQSQGIQEITVPVTVTNSRLEQYESDFIRDVAPVLSKVGCNAGTCHGSAKGKNGFKLSLRGYDPIFDVRALTDDLASRRVNLASPDDSLMLLKSTGAVPHEGGQVIRPGGPRYMAIRNWIAAGAKLDLSSARVQSITLEPENPVIGKIGSRQQVRIVAHYTDGSAKDVTREAFVTSGNTEIATASETGLMTAIRRGEAPILARYEGAYAATTLTVMGDRTGFVWSKPPQWNEIDKHTAAKWQRMKIQPSELCTDAEFLRRAYLDLTGLPPTVEEIQKFLADKRDTQVKRAEVVDRLIGSEAFIVYWTNKWADLLQVNRKFLGPEGSAAFRQWIREQVEQNRPYDEFARDILTATGSNRVNPAASYFKILREPTEIMENTTHLFLGVRFNCNKCHDHPFERWTQDQYYETAAFFARVGLKADPKSGNRKIGGTAVEGAKPYYEEVYLKPAGEVIHVRTGDVAQPEFPFEADFTASEDATRRERLAAWITSPDNPYFAKSYVNRLWGYLFGVGLMEPIDDLRAGNPPTNPELLDYLTDEFIASGFDTQHIFKLIANSRTYQLSVKPNEWNEDDRINYSHAIARRLPAEVLYDSIYQVTGATSKIPGVPPGTRAAALPDVGVTLPDNFLGTLGRPVRESACECERSDGMQLGPVMAFVSGPTVGNAISDPNNDLARLTKEIPDNRELIDRLFLRILNRPATGEEIEATLATMGTIDEDHAELRAKLEAKEAEWKPVRAKLEGARADRITQAEAALKAYEKELAPKLAEQQKQREEKIAQAQAALDAYAKTLPGKLAAWEAAQGQTTGWRTITFDQLKSSNNAKLTQEADGAVFVSGPNGKTVYTLTATLPAAQVTGLRLEALTDSRLPSQGPGRPPNGNFVLTELEVTAAPKANPNQKVPVKLANAKADFSQNNYDVKTAIDGQRSATNNGWAVSPQTGKPHTAVFEVAEPAKLPAGEVVLTITMTQQYNDGKHSLGKFRLALTGDPKPLHFGLPEHVTKTLATARDQRTEDQSKKLLAFFQSQDGEYQKKQAALEESKKPLPTDPKLTDLQKKLETAQKPVQDDPKLVELRQTVEMSKQQLDNKRLTAAQDLAWALINTPAFLFNH